MTYRFRKGTFARELSDALEALGQLREPLDETPEYMPITKAAELRYTLGPVYIPSVLDAHNEFVDEDELRKSIWELSDKGDRKIRKQHGEQVIGVQRELFQWPFELAVDLKLPDGTVTKSVTLPAGTAYAGVQWDESAWPDVKKGLIRGYSIGGRAVRIRDIEDVSLRKLS